MSSVVWKYQVPVAASFCLEMPCGAKILSVQTQRDMPVLWALVDPAERDVPVEFRVMNTGTPIDVPLDAFHNQFEVVGTFQLSSGLVFHLFREKETT